MSRLRLCLRLRLRVRLRAARILPNQLCPPPNPVPLGPLWLRTLRLGRSRLGPLRLALWPFLPEKLAPWTLFACAPNLNLIPLSFNALQCTLPFSLHLQPSQQCAVSFVVEFSVITKRALVGGGPIETDWDRFEFQYFLARCLRETCASNRLRLI